MENKKQKKDELNQIEKNILKICSQKWFENQAGISALDLQDNLKLKNRQIMKLFEQLVEKGKGKINKNVVLYEIKFSIDIEKPRRYFPKGRKRVTHIFFPSEDVLKNRYYSSKLARKDNAEYTKRLLLGANQIELVFFEEEVLKKYYDHPEKYSIQDTLAGGNIESLGNSSESNYLHIRYGKKLINNGKTAIATIMKDLEMMSNDEQNYWSSFEIKEFVADRNDSNFGLFVARTYDGEFVDYPDIFLELKSVLENLNTILGKSKLYKLLENKHLRLPVENTWKAFCDSCSELYKLIGPDNMNNDALKQFLISKYNILESSLLNDQSKRPFSSIQLIKELEKQLECGNEFSATIDEVKKYRIEADHKIIETIDEESNISKMFVDLCKKYIRNENKIITLITKKKID